MSRAAKTVFLTSVQVRARYGGRSAMWLPRLIAAGKFPKPTRLGGGRWLYWKLEDLEKWEAEQARAA
jgi:predicted DNA-binding transcriptional regulator AlpA